MTAVLLLFSAIALAGIRICHGTLIVYKLDFEVDLFVDAIVGSRKTFIYEKPIEFLRGKYDNIRETEILMVSTKRNQLKYLW